MVESSDKCSEVRKIDLSECRLTGPSHRRARLTEKLRSVYVGRFLCFSFIFTLSCGAEKSRNPLSPSIAGPIDGVNLSSPTLETPANGTLLTEDVQPIILSFTNASSNGERVIYYELTIAKDPEFYVLVYSVADILADPSGRTHYPLPITLESDQTYFWHVRAIDGANVGAFSTSSSFEIYIPLKIEAPIPISPINGIEIDGGTPTLVIDGAMISGPAKDVRYRFEVATDQGFSDVVTVVETASDKSGGRLRATIGTRNKTHRGQSTFDLDKAYSVRGQTGELEADTIHYWRARASADGREGNVVGPWSVVGSFRTGKQRYTLESPTLMSPIDGDVVLENPVRFVVRNPVVGGTRDDVKIHFQVDVDLSFSSPTEVFAVPMSSGSMTTGVSNTLPSGSLFFWRASISDNSAMGPWSAGENFRTPDSVPGGSAPRDELNLEQVRWLHSNVSSWPRASTVTKTFIGDPPICIEHTKSSVWPSIASRGTKTAVAGNPWIFAKVDGQWYGATFEWLRSGQTCKQISAADLGPHIKKSPLDGWVPTSGEEIGLMVSTPARAGPEGPVRERSNVVLTRWP